MQHRTGEKRKSDGQFDVSVILPTYNRRQMLAIVLNSLEKQTFNKDRFEVVVSDDGSSDGTQEFLKEYGEKTTNCFQYILAKENSGPAKARNLALQRVKGSVIIIIGDDIEVGEHFIQQHFDWHCLHDAPGDAVLGYVTWPESIQPSSFMRWLETGGRFFFFRYADFQSGCPVDCRNFYTCNVSVKRLLLAKTSFFDESFPYASHEDLELGERLGKVGMTLYFEKTILGYHHHFLHIKGIAKRVYLMGYSAHIFWQKVPDQSSLQKKALRIFLRYFFSLPWAWPLLMRILKRSVEKEAKNSFCWKIILIMSYWIGLADAGRGRAIKTFL